MNNKAIKKIFLNIFFLFKKENRKVKQVLSGGLATVEGGKCRERG
jgi:hypothetical protein